MKKTIFAITIFLVLITIGVLEQVYIHKTFNELKAKAIEIEKLIESSPTDAHRQSIELEKWWKKRKAFLESFISHNETREMTIRLSELEGYASISDDKSSMATVSIVVELCDNLIHTLGISWDTIL